MDSLVSEAPTPVTPVAVLPLEVVTRVLSFVLPTELDACQLVSKVWHACGQPLWRWHCVRVWPSLPAHVTNYRTYYVAVRAALDARGERIAVLVTVRHDHVHDFRLLLREPHGQSATVTLNVVRMATNKHHGLVEELRQVHGRRWHIWCSKLRGR